MALKNFGQLKTEVQEWLGLTTLDETTEPKLSRVESFINDSIAEVLSEFNYRQLETSCQIPFTHTINMQGVWLSGVSTSPTSGTGITGSIIPYPSDAQSQLVNCTVLSTYSGITFNGVDAFGDPFVGTSITGSGITGPVTTVGYQYELPLQVDQIYSITVPQNGIKLAYIPQYDIDRMIPIGATTASGTPTWYTEFDGISASGNKVIQFYPQPLTTTYSGSYFTVHYKKKLMDLVNDTDVQSAIPSNFQDIIVWATLEKCASFLSDDKTQYYQAKKMERTNDLKIWASNHLDYVFVERDGDFLSANNNSAYNTTVQFRL